MVGGPGKHSAVLPGFGSTAAVTLARRPSPAWRSWTLSSTAGNRDHPDRPWNPAADPTEARNREHHASHPVGFREPFRRMDRAGVDAALLVTSAVYGTDNSYPLAAAAAEPT